MHSRLKGLDTKVFGALKSIPARCPLWNFSGYQNKAARTRNPSPEHGNIHVFNTCYRDINYCHHRQRVWTGNVFWKTSEILAHHASKTTHLSVGHNLSKFLPISKILSLWDSRGNFVHIVIKILHLTLNVCLHYLAKLENHNSCRFQRHIACETSEFILQDMRPLKKLRSESHDYKIWKTMRKNSEKDP